MELTDRQRKQAFAIIVVVLVAVGLFITLGPTGSDSDEEAQPDTTATGAAATDGGAGTDIYALLPFSAQEYAGAAALAQRFVVAYGTYRYDQDPQEYTRRLEDMATPELLTSLERSMASPGIVQERRENRTISTGQASLNGIRNITGGTIIFLVQGEQQINESGETSTDSEEYAVTVSNEDGDWMVHAFQPASIGQPGDVE